jgi:TusA-related sulfurtransferase
MRAFITVDERRIARVEFAVTHGAARAAMRTGEVALSRRTSPTASRALDAHQGTRRAPLQQCHDERDVRVASNTKGALMGRELVLDVRGMQPPEPIERVLDAIDDFVPGDRLKLIIDCHPVPLFRILDQNGFAHLDAPGAESVYEIAIWRK